MGYLGDRLDAYRWGRWLDQSRLLQKLDWMPLYLDQTPAERIALGAELSEAAVKARRAFEKH